jgi:DNA-binding CsgD family transcriptional regulator
MRITTKAGFTNREYEEAKVTWSADNEYGRGMIGTAVRTGNLQIGRNLLSNPAVAPWRDLLERSGYESAVIVPLKTHAGVFATLLVCAGEPWAFEKEEIALLQELGDDLSFGIGSLLAKKFAEEHEELSGAAGQTGKNILSKLSQREREVLFPVLDGHSSKEIAAVLGISPASVDTYRSRLMFKLDVEDTSSLIRLAIKEGIIEA